MSALVHPARLVEQVGSRLQEAGLSADRAAQVAGVLVDADVRGHHSHGVELLPTYLRRIEAGGIRPDAEPTWLPASGSVAVLDAQGAPGQVGMWLAVERAVEMARAQGAAVVGVRNNNHVGMMAAYRGPLAEAGLVGLLLNISGPSVAAPGGQRATLGNGACCLVAPIPGRDPFVADFATGIVALGKIRHLGVLGEPVPDGWLLDAEGRPSNRAEDLDAGGSVPVFGDHKGLCVALIIEVLAGMLAGGTVSPRVHKQRQEPETPMGCSQLLVVLDPAAFGALDLSGLHDILEASVRAGYDDPPTPHYPEQKERAAEQRHAEGVEVAEAVLEVLR